MSEIAELQSQIRAFADAREWSQFHTLRNLVLALTGEVGELAAEIQWLPDSKVAIGEMDQSKSAAIESELADVATYVLRLADILYIDLAQAVRKKLQLNETRYPVEKARGNALKYSELGET
jgi:dCTP diphosphatase